ncbi:MAG TPA: VWA domain-containing protein, partial [Planctomycetota bacterium]|nr:VWA domain-containing protein [Planctomycetota bacterium]
SLAMNVPWNITVKIKSKQRISTTYSPSHKTESTQVNPFEVHVKVAPDAATEPGPFILSYLTNTSDKMTATLMAYPDARIGGGYFLLLAAVPPADEQRPGAPEVKREVTVVIDRSGSMAGEKMEQARAAALQVVEGLFDGEAFNIMDYSGAVAMFAPAPVIKDRKNVEEARHYLRRLTAGGGTNINDALVEALRQTPTRDMLPIVLFLTDGLPTVGVRDEVAIRETAAKTNTFNRRIFTFGVGYDVNAPLLGFLAQKSRAISTFVLPDENVEEKVSQVYRRLSGPVMSEPKIETLDAAGAVTTRRVNELQPGSLPDLFEGDKLVLLGSYAGGEPLKFRLHGSFRGRPRAFEFTFGLGAASVQNSFVPRLWATRKVASLIDEIRQAGAGASFGQPPPPNPRMKELVDEIVRLSTEFGILTEYTAFLAREGTNLSKPDDILREAAVNLKSRAIGARSGVGGVNQAMNSNFQSEQVYGNRRNRYYDKNMESVQVANVLQASDRTFYQRGNRWIDSRAVGAKDSIKIDKRITFGSAEYMKLLDRLVTENRQSTIAMKGEILLNIDDMNVLLVGPEAIDANAAASITEAER